MPARYASQPGAIALENVADVWSVEPVGREATCQTPRWWLHFLPTPGPASCISSIDVTFDDRAVQTSWSQRLCDSGLE